ncbi:hypothetical protein SeLEV6574_g05695 [Synchytrium endobioticum]|uniref:Uncharacterized protein n=1 Tax=Synchytrium endobioticum TaxID=286115 RepID=A0A507CSW7_9FUNG|nr:hypothetical protein SeLEV6574_g05695 [Synchytrium endobioticum]
MKSFKSLFVIDKKHMDERLQKASKTGVLTLGTLQLKEIPPQVFSIDVGGIKNADFSCNKIASMYVF